MGEACSYYFTFLLFHGIGRAKSIKEDLLGLSERPRGKEEGSLLASPVGRSPKLESSFQKLS